MLSKVSEKLGVRKSILYVLIAAFLFSFYNFFILEEITNIKDMKLKITELEAELNYVEKEVKGITPDQLADKERKIKELEQQYMNGLISQLVLLELGEFVQEANLELVSFTSNKITEHQNYKQRGYEIQLKGEYSEFIHWLRIMEDTPDYITQGTLQIARSQNTAQTGELIFALSLNAIALGDNLTWEPYNAQNFRSNPFQPGIGY